MNTKTNTLIVILAIVLIIGAVALTTYKKSDTQETVIPTPTPTYTVESYVSENISTLSPIKEQVGGKFFVTKIEASGGEGVVEYEDGHNAYTADFTYSTDENGNPKIETFKVR
jgi:hypothetical protein